MTVCSSFNIKELDEIAEMVNKSTHHPFVNHYVVSPSMSMAGVHLLLLMLSQANIEPIRKRSLCLSLVLIQMGLETHESVSVRKTQTKRASLTRQLSVLAGDYYSSKYYQILSSFEEIDLVQSLSIAISEINEAKMKLYIDRNNNTLDTESYFAYTEAICSRLYVRFADWLGASISSNWGKILSHTLLAERLAEQLEELSVTGMDELQIRMENKIHSNLAVVEKESNLLDFETKLEVNEIVMALRNKLMFSTRYANEV